MTIADASTPVKLVATRPVFQGQDRHEGAYFASVRAYFMVDCAGIKLLMTLSWYEDNRTSSDLEICFEARTPCCEGAFERPPIERVKQGISKECGTCETPYSDFNVSSHGNRVQKWGEFANGQFTPWICEDENGLFSEPFDENFVTWTESYGLGLDPLEFVLFVSDLPEWVETTVKLAAEILPEIPIPLLTPRGQSPVATDAVKHMFAGSYCSINVLADVEISGKSNPGVRAKFKPATPCCGSGFQPGYQVSKTPTCRTCAKVYPELSGALTNMGWSQWDGGQIYWRIDEDLAAAGWESWASGQGQDPVTALLNSTGFVEWAGQALQRAMRDIKHVPAGFGAEHKAKPASP